MAGASVTGTIGAPTYTQTINQQFFIEAQTGAKPPTSYLDWFPESVYTHALDSTLVTLLYVLMGPVGAGLVRSQYLEARAKVESALLRGTDLDAMYADPFGFARLAEETYEWDASASLLSAQDRATILALDSRFRNRAREFLRAVRAGGTKKGIRLAAQSGLNDNCVVVENYVALWDQFTDLPLGVAYKGKTTQTNEAIIIPWPNKTPKSNVQEIQITGAPQSGWFTLSVPVAPNYNIIPVTTTTSTTTVTVPDSTQTPIGTYLNLSSTPTSATTHPANPTYFAEVVGIVSPTVVTIAPFPGFSGMTFPTNNTYWGYAGYGQTIPLPYNARWPDVLSALIALPVVGIGNVLVSGGPFPTLPMQVSFTDNLANEPMPIMEFNIDADPITGVTGLSGQLPQLADVTNTPLVNSNGVATQEQIGQNGTRIEISPTNWHNAHTAVNTLKPLTSIVTTSGGNPKVHAYKVNRVFAPVRETEVIHFVTGNAKVKWHKRDKKHWVIGGAPVPGPKHHKHRPKKHHHFHDVSSIVSYTEQAVFASDYGTTNSSEAPLWARFYNVHSGAYNPDQAALYPLLAGQTGIMQASYAPAPLANPLVISTLDDGTGIINDEYPVDYLNLPNVPALPTRQHKWYWSSKERFTGTDHLHIDLGKTKAVNFIAFEATRKPYAISISYDSLDQPNQYRFTPVTLVPPTVYHSTTSLSYDSSATNPWKYCYLAFTDPTGHLIHTRYLRIDFIKIPGSSPLAQIPYSIEVRNLRCGRLELGLHKITPGGGGTPTSVLTATPGIIA